MYAFINLLPFSLASILIHRKNAAHKDSAQPVGRNDNDEDLILGIADESKAPNTKAQR
jgi:hypothetical protein